MFRVYINDQTEEYPIYEPLDEDLRIFEPILTQEMGKGGTFKFYILANHPYADKVGLLKTEVTVYRDDKAIFHGRILKPEYSMNNLIAITCEGDSTYLIDSVQRPYEFTGSIPDFISAVLEVHNSQVDDFKKIYPGIITVTDENSNITRSETKYTSSYDTLKSKLVEVHGGFLRIRNAAGKKYLDYLYDYGGINVQEIRFGENLLNIDHYLDASSIITCLIPVGDEVEYTDTSGEKQVKTVDITSVNNGLDYIQSEAAVEKYGKVWGTYQFKDVTDPEILLAKAKAYLLEMSALPTNMDVTAIDLSLLDETVQGFEIGYWTRIISEPHDIEKQLMLTKRVINLIDPTAGSISFGKTSRGYMEQILKSQNESIKSIDRIGNSLNKEIIRKIENATQLITGGRGGYVVFDMDDPDTGKRALPWRILVMDAPEKESAQSVIQINKNGIGFSTTGINGPYLNAWTIDGNLLADVITAGTMLADRIRGGMLEIGGNGLGKDGRIVVKDANDEEIGYWDKTGFHVLLGVIEGTTIKGSSIVGGTIDIGNGVFTVDKYGDVSIGAGEISIGNVLINENYTWLGDFGLSGNGKGLFYSRDSGRAVQIASSSWDEFPASMVLQYKGNKTRYSASGIVTSGDIFFDDPWTEYMSALDMFKDLYNRISDLRQRINEKEG